MKRFYRFLRGELNGYYIQQLNSALNNLTQSLESFFISFGSLVYQTSENVTAGETAIDTDKLNGLGRFMGFLPPFSYLDVLPTALRFTTSHKVLSTEYSERGLYSVSEENFSFKRTDQNDYTDDINTLATSENRSSLVELGASIVGYFQEGDDIIQEDGNLDMTKLLSTPPSDKAYSAFYGEKYLTFDEGVNVFQETPSNLYYEIQCILQKVRYNTPSIETLCQLAEALCSGFLTFESYEWRDSYALLIYSVDQETKQENKTARLVAFKLICALKFNQVVLQEKSAD